MKLESLADVVALEAARKKIREEACDFLGAHYLTISTHRRNHQLDRRASEPLAKEAFEAHWRALHLYYRCMIGHVETKLEALGVVVERSTRLPKAPDEEWPTS